MSSPDPGRRRSALQFALDITGGRDVVYRVAVYLQDLQQKLATAPGLLDRARIDLILCDDQEATVVDAEHLIEAATRAAIGHAPLGMRLRPLIDRLSVLPYEGGGFHTFVLLTRTPNTGWLDDLSDLHQLVGSVTGLCCGPECSPIAALHVSKEPGGSRVVNPLDTIRMQFDSIAMWLSDNFADRPAVVPLPEVRAMPDLPTEPEPPPVIPPVVAAKWRVLEPTDPADATPHLIANHLAGVAGWRMIGASRRGKLHAHEGSYRDDAFALGAYAGWNLVAVADGAGSCRLSRVGARVATDAAITGMQAGIDRFQHITAEDNPEDALRAIITQGCEAAQMAVYTEAGRRGIPVRDLSSTLLLLAHGPAAEYLLAGQIGDGLIMAVQHDQTLQVLGEAGKGVYSGETVFLTGIAAHAWQRHAWVYPITEAPDMVLVMTDGIADDLIPYQRQAPTLINGIRSILPKAHTDQALLETLSYEKRDSADDRTLVVLHHDEKQA